MRRKIHYPLHLASLKDKLEQIKVPARLVFFIMGIASTLWFLIRVVPKPSRASYPCVRATAPFMSGFIIYLLSLGTAVFAFRKFKQKALQAKYILAVTFLLISISASVFYLVNDSKNTFAAAPPDGSNNPMGTAQGIMPGRVVWSWDSTATNAYCTNSGGKSNTYDSSTCDYYFNPKNNDQSVIDKMVGDGIKKIADKPTEEEAWDAIFHYFNKAKTGQDSGYKNGQIIFIKINQGSMSWGGNFNYPDFSRNIPKDYDIVEANPFTIVALLKSLINKAKVPEDKIIVGEPMRNIYKDIYDYIRKDFKKVNILGNNLLSNVSFFDLTSVDRMPVAVGNDTIFYSTKSGILKDNLYDIYSYSNYVINIANLKGHARAGITLCAKNHFGSQTRESAAHLHDSLPSDEKFIINGGYKKYRPQVDIMGHPKLGGNTILFMVDGLYSGEDGYVAPSRKWRMQPFNNNYPSSIFMSQDQVALESVCFDFLRTEYDGTEGRKNYPNYSGADDYLHQAADSTARPAYIKYKPDGKHTFGNLGVHEHWNNSADKKYSRNLDPVNGKGIELIGLLKTSALGDHSSTNSFAIESVYPNPASVISNVTYVLSEPSLVKVEIFDLNGKKVATIKQQKESVGEHMATWDINEPSGIYYCKISAEYLNGTRAATCKIQVIK